jgi:phage protein D
MDEYAVGMTVLVDGAELDPALVAHIEQLVVDDDLQRPGMFALTMFDPTQDIVRRTGMRAGAEIEVSIAVSGVADAGPLLKGDVVSVECDYDEIGSRVVVRGYAASHRLQRGRRTRTFQDVTDSDMVRQIVDEAGIELGEIEDTKEVHRHVTQPNQTDWDFLVTRAHRLGLDLTVAGGSLRFGSRPASSGAPPEADADSDPAGLDPRHLVYGYNLKAFHGRMSAAQQVARVEIRGWDQDRKEPVVAAVAAGTRAAGLAVGDPSTFAHAFGDRTFVEVSTPIGSEREAEDAAAALAERIGSAFAEAEGTAVGSTALRAGVAVRVSRVTEDFNGAYVLSQTRHVVDRTGYRTHFTISGRQDRSLLGLVRAGVGAAGAETVGAVDGTAVLVRGTVSENADPEKLGRVRVRLPWLDAAFSSAWAPVVQLGAGPASGTFFLPAVGDEVLVGFEHGQVDRPIVVGGLFNKTDQPPVYGQYLDNGAVTGRAIVSRQGHQLVMHDANDLSGITISVLDADRRTVVSIGLNALEEKLVIRAQGAIDIDAGGEVTLRGSKVTVQSDGDLVLKGKRITLN